MSLNIDVLKNVYKKIRRSLEMKKASKSPSQVSLKEREEIDKNWNFRQKCVECLSGPKQIIRSIVLLTCTVVVIYQIAECLKKIQNPPTTTYTHFDFNGSIRYPAVTLCRDPPYKNDVLKNHGLIGHPRTTSEWRYFPFDTTDLDEFWNEATYDDSDNLINYALFKSRDNVMVVNYLHFLHGKCQTLYPKIDMTVTDKESGYSILLNHSLTDMMETTSTIPPGYHVYIHQTNELFVEPPTGTLVDYLYVKVGEELDVKLGVQEVNMLVGGPKSCDGRDDYSVSECLEHCRLLAVKEVARCSGPWMESDESPRCHNYTLMRELIVNYIRVSEDNDLDCPCLSRCRSSIYTTHVVDRNHVTVWNAQTKSYTLRSEPERQQTQVSGELPFFTSLSPVITVYIYFNTKSVSVYEEKHGYDWSLFLADFGGSLGFLLGLSVLGIITLIETLYDTMFKPLASEKDKKASGFDDVGYRKGMKVDEPRKSQRHIGDGDSMTSEEYAEKMSYAEKKDILNVYGDDKHFDKNFYI